MTPLRLAVADLLAHPGSRRAVEVVAEVEDLAGTGARVVGPVRLHLSLERISEGIVVRGRVEARWRGECSRCLRELDGRLDVGVDELFEPGGVAGDTYPIDGHEIDLEQLVRDALVLELPLVPHCSESCEPALGPQDASFAPDPRWAALADLRLEPPIRENQ